MAKLINELLLLTCMGGFIASATYAVTLLHGRRANLIRAGASFVAIAFAVLAARPFRGADPRSRTSVIPIFCVRAH